nr:hypothetical protein [Novosphingobium sp. BW1]
MPILGTFAMLRDILLRALGPSVRADPRALPMALVFGRLCFVAGTAERLQVIRGVCAALGFRRLVVDVQVYRLTIFADRSLGSDPTLRKAGLAKVLVTLEDCQALFVPGASVSAFMPRLAIMMPCLARLALVTCFVRQWDMGH